MSEEAVLETPTEVADAPPQEEAQEPQGGHEAQPEPSEAQPTQEVTEQPMEMPPWLNQLVSFTPEKREPEEVPLPEAPDLSEIDVDQDALAAMQQMMRREIQESLRNSEVSQIAQEFRDYKQRNAESAVKATVATVRDEVYNKVFAQDPTFRSNQQFRDHVDGMTQQWVQTAAAAAYGSGDTSALQFVHDPRFGHAMLGMMKGYYGISDSGQSSPVVPPGAEVATGTGSPMKTEPRLTKEQRDFCKARGIDPKQYIKDLAASDYDGEYDHE